MKLRAKLLLICLPLVAASSNTNISYEVRWFGSSNAVMILSGDNISGISVAPNAEGTSFRVSGVGAIFQRKGEDSNLPLFTSVNQVRRGAATDLIVNLSEPSQISAIPSAGTLQISIAKISNQSALPARTVEPNKLSPTDEIKALREENARLRAEVTQLKTKIGQQNTSN